MRIEQTQVFRHDQVKGVYRVLALEAPSISAAARPGQFVHLKVPRLSGALLRRPFSICHAADGRISILYKPVGRGTVAMTELVPGDAISVMGPLGNGFPKPSNDSLPVLVAGGYGIGPLYFLASQMNSKGIAFIGGRSGDDILCAEEMSELGWDVRITTEDGSSGTVGLVSEAIDKWIADSGTDGAEIFACGPDGMLRAVGERAVDRKIRAWLSLDRRMGCGIGACLACVQKIRREEGSEQLVRVCRDGPVFEASSVVWEQE